MDKIELYGQSIQILLQEHSGHAKKNVVILKMNCFLTQSAILLAETLCDRYQLMRVGWQEFKRIYHTVMHFDIKDGKIWIQQNMTDIDVGQELVNMGIAKEDIILGLQPPYKRPYTGYGVA